MTGPDKREDWRRVPHPGRLSPEHARYDEIIERHDTAQDRGVASYTDPISGFSVFTADFLAGRRYCCESGCRHCPYAM